jgi:hypothetical protein
MKCNFRASILSCTFASACFGHKPKVTIAALLLTKLSNNEQITMLGVGDMIFVLAKWIKNEKK